MRSRLEALVRGALTICALSSFLSLGNLGCAGASKSAASPAQYPAATGGAPSEPQSESVRVASTGNEERSEPAFADAAKPSPPPPAPAKARDADAPAPAAPPPPPSSAPRAAQPTAPAEKPDPTKQAVQNRDFVIYTARFTMAIYQVEQGLAAVERIARDNGGYLGMKKDSEITVRIPRGRFEITLAAIDKVGDVLHRDIQAQDVTDEHVDLEIRIKNARAMQQRLSDLLTKASVKDALEIEKELHRVTEELERLEGRMKVLKDKIAFSTVTVQFQPRGAALPSARVHLPFPWLGGLNLPSLLSLSEEK